MYFINNYYHFDKMLFGEYFYILHRKSVIKVKIIEHYIVNIESYTTAKYRNKIITHISYLYSMALHNSPAAYNTTWL